MAKSKAKHDSLRRIRSETEYDAALVEIAPYFAREPKPGTPAANRFDLLADLIEDYEKKRWPIDPPGSVNVAP